jgi:hypothetical protein
VRTRRRLSRLTPHYVPRRVWKKLPDTVTQAVVEFALKEPELSPRELAISSSASNALGQEHQIPAHKREWGSVAGLHRPYYCYQSAAYGIAGIALRPRFARARRTPELSHCALFCTLTKSHVVSIGISRTTRPNAEKPFAAVRFLDIVRY